jgi:integrase-like protein
MKLRDDGWWLIFPPARLKGTPREIPLNRIAVQALRSEILTVDDQIFRRWTQAALTYWGRLCKRAKIQDLRFHDLRHSIATRLQNLGIGLEIRSALLGHKVRGLGGDFGSEAMTSRYSHGGHGWNQELRRAATLLESAYSGSTLSYRPSYEGSGDDATTDRKVANTKEDQRKAWWSQRDSNPCLGLERAPS